MRPDADTPLLRRIREGVIGDDQVMVGPFGARRVTYADYTASGRALTFIEDVIRNDVLPRYGNTHTESSGTGLQTSRLREDARRIVRDGVGGGDETSVIFCGSGATGAVDKLIGILGLRLPSALEERFGVSQHVPAETRPVVFVGPFEHHSNELPWREALCDVVTIPEDSDGHIDIAQLEAELVRHAGRPLKIGSFSAASNVTGILSNTCAIADLLHRHGALSFWDFAAAAPYVEIEMKPHCPRHPLAYKDAIFFSPHKFVGGPGTPGVLAIRTELLENEVPDVVGGGTVAYVNAEQHRYLADPEQREEGGTPAIVESIRAGLVMQLKQAVGVETIQAHERDYWRRAIAQWNENPSIEILGNVEAERLSIVSFVVHPPGGRYLHHNFVVAVLNDLFGIQARGGCSCAGPYGHRLLGIELERSHEYEHAIAEGCEGIKPGWTRVSFNYFISETVFQYIVDAVDLVATQGWRLLPAYRFDSVSGLWRHRDGLVEPPLRLTAISYDPGTGALMMPHLPVERAPESALAGHLAEARLVLDAAQGGHEESDLTEQLGSEFEHLRWFDLPQVCLS